MTPAGGSAQAYSYTGFGNNTSRLTNGSGTEVRGPEGLQATITSSGAGYSFHYTPDGRLISSELPDGTSRYYLTDLLGSVVAVSGANSFTAKYAYDPYGNTRSTSGGEAGSNPFRYTGAYTDAAAGGLYKMGARYYDPVTGRFTQPGPSGQESNSFAYARNNSVNEIDPTGLDTYPCYAYSGTSYCGYHTYQPAEDLAYKIFDTTCSTLAIASVTPPLGAGLAAPDGVCAFYGAARTSQEY